MTPLHFACQSNAIEIAKLLIDKGADINEKEKLIELKDLQITLNGLRGYNEAIITQGGIKVKEVNPTTMESRLVDGLRFAGEVLDVDAFTGGYNLQIAWSTGWAAGSTIE